MKTRDDILGIMDKYKERLWMQYQVGLEYFNNRKVVINGVKDGPNLYNLSVDRYCFMIADYMMVGLRDRRTWEEIPFEALEND